MLTTRHAHIFGLDLPTGAVQVVGHVSASWRGDPAQIILELLEHDALAGQQQHSLEWALEWLMTERGQHAVRVRKLPDEPAGSD